MPALAAPAAGGGSRATAGLVLLLCLACQCLAQAQQEGCLLTLLRKPDAAINCTDTRPGNICMLSATIFPSNTNMPTNRVRHLHSKHRHAFPLTQTALSLSLSFSPFFFIAI